MLRDYLSCNGHATRTCARPCLARPCLACMLRCVLRHSKPLPVATDDEMEVAALLGVAVPTYLINDGARDNRGAAAASGSYEPEAVIVDMVGCRFERAGLMEWRHMVVTPEQVCRHEAH